MRSTSATAIGQSKQSGTHIHTHTHTQTHTYSHRDTTRAKQSSAGDGHLRCTDEFPLASRFYLFIRYYYYPCTLRHTHTRTHSHTRTQHVILRALLSTLRAEAEAKAEQRMCFIGTFCTIAAPFLPSPSSYPHPSALNERGIAEESRGRRSWS